MQAGLGLSSCVTLKPTSHRADNVSVSAEGSEGIDTGRGVAILPAPPSFRAKTLATLRRPPWEASPVVPAVFLDHPIHLGGQLRQLLDDACKLGAHLGNRYLLVVAGLYLKFERQAQTV